MMLRVIKEWICPGWMFRLPPQLAKCVAVTFDDGPDPNTTPQLLDTLSRLGIPTTHFAVGEKVFSHPSLLSAISEQGHLLANHGYYHESFLWKSARTQTESIAATDGLLRQHGVRSSSWFRPPFGHFNISTKSVLDDLGYHGVFWSVSVRDWSATTPETLWRRLRTLLHERAIILLHDAHPTTPIMTEMLPHLADEISRRGWEFITLPSHPVNSSL